MRKDEDLQAKFHEWCKANNITNAVVLFEVNKCTATGIFCSTPMPNPFYFSIYKQFNDALIIAEQQQNN